MRVMNDFVEKFTDLAAVNNRSPSARLQNLTSHEIQAAAKALWIHTLRSRGNTDELYAGLGDAEMAKALLAARSTYVDENQLVSTEYREYWELTDTLGLSPGVRQQMQDELAGKFLHRAEAEGFVVINDSHGIWLFKFDA
jgi:hypothetical protein